MNTKKRTKKVDLLKETLSEMVKPRATRTPPRGVDALIPPQTITPPATVSPKRIAVANVAEAAVLLSLSTGGLSTEEETRMIDALDAARQMVELIRQKETK